MKIGIDCRIYSSKFTGIGRYVHELISRIAKLDQENQYILFFNHPEYENFKLPSKNFKKVLADAPIYSLREQFHFLEILKNEKLDLMHFTHFNAPLFYRGPSIVTIHDLTLSFYPGKKKRSIIHRLGYHLTFRSAVRKAKKIITISENSKKDLMKLIGTKEEKIQIIYQGVGDEFKKLPEKEVQKSLDNLHITEPFFLYTGVWRSHKNIPNMIKAFNEVKKHPECKNLKLVMTGNENPLYPEIKETIQECDLEDDVIFSGLVPEQDLLALYNAAQIYIFPSFYEGFGLPPLEAMACGTPVAASNSSSIPEIAGKDNAVFFDPENYEEMAEKIYLLYKNQNLQKKLIKRGFERIKKFDWQKTASETLNLYKKCLLN